MPIEINELHIRVSVDATGPSRPAGAPTRPGGGDAAGPREEIVAECVEHVLRVLADREER